MISLALSSAYDTPVHFLFAIIKNSNDKIFTIPNNVIHITEWGKTIDKKEAFINIYDKNAVIHILWFSILENLYYEFMQPLGSIVQEEGKVIIGCSSKGRVCFWDYNEKSVKIISYTKGKCVDDYVRQSISNSKVVVISENELYSPNELNMFLKKELSIKIHHIDFDGNNLDKKMQQFLYRYIISFEKSDDKSIALEKYKVRNVSIENTLFDGTYDKLNDGGLLKYHQAGKPKKLAIKWHIGKSEYSAYFWFEEEPIREVFDKFYGAHPDTKTDFIIRIDAENKKYELALYRYGLKELQIISEDVYQLLVFKNKFEDYRSDNYNQERGAWIW